MCWGVMKAWCLEGGGSKTFLVEKECTIYHQDTCPGKIMFLPWKPCVLFQLFPIPQREYIRNLETMVWIFSVPLVIVYTLVITS